jgi:hypothetical protein
VWCGDRSREATNFGERGRNRTRILWGSSPEALPLSLLTRRINNLASAADVFKGDGSN